ncbi:YeiH family protein [Azospira inquinata]|nr:YeiH family protein [Azospira inquinata]
MCGRLDTEGWSMQRLAHVFPGVLLIAGLSLAAYVLAVGGGLARYGASSLTLAIVLGAVLGNLRPHWVTGRCHGGVQLAQKEFLRTGVALYGFNLSLQQILQVGSSGIVVDLLLVSSTLAMGWWIGTRLLKLDKETVLLTTAGSAICGAAAVVATVPVLGGDGERVADKTTTAVATVVLFGTLAMVLYPLLHAWTGIDGRVFGVYVGSTVHEVAQVVAIGSTIGGDTASNAVIVKMIRVMLLVPFLLGLSFFLSRRRQATGGKAKIAVPWFAVAFVALAGVNSLHWLPDAWVQALRLLGVLLLTAAMGALGLGTTVAKMRKAGMGPLLLASGLFAHLVLVGGAINWLVARW